MGFTKFIKTVDKNRPRANKLCRLSKKRKLNSQRRCGLAFLQQVKLPYLDRGG
jgi:hypothetical protein